MEEWALSEEDRPVPPWLFYGLAVSAGIAIISLVLMAFWLVAMFLVPRSWIP